MDAIKGAATGISVAAVILGGLYFLSPDGNVGKRMKYVIGLIMLLCTVTPFLNSSFTSISLPSSAFSVAADDMLIKNAEYLISETLKKEGIIFEKIELSADISESGDISINSVYIYGARDKDKAKELIEGTFVVQEVVFCD